jgi:hypothetical protein
VRVALSSSVGWIKFVILVKSQTVIFYGGGERMLKKTADTRLPAPRIQTGSVYYRRGGGRRWWFIAILSMMMKKS